MMVKRGEKYLTQENFVSGEFHFLQDSNEGLVTSFLNLRVPTKTKFPIFFRVFTSILIDLYIINTIFFVVFAVN